MIQFDIRPARMEDCAEISRLIHMLAAYEKLADQCGCTPEKMREALFATNSGPKCVLLWARDSEVEQLQERPVGFALYFFNFSTFRARQGLYLEDLFVEPEYRGQGAGGMLMRHLALEAAKKGCARFEWVVLDWNQPAIDFYERLGAKILSDWRICRLEGEALEKLVAEAERRR